MYMRVAVSPHIHCDKWNAAAREITRRGNALRAIAKAPIADDVCNGLLRSFSVVLA